MPKISVNISLKALMLGVLIGCLWFYASSSFSQAPPPRVVVAEKSGSPLLILLTGLDSSNPLEPKYSYSITNTTEKSVSAYAVQDSVSLGPGAPIVGSSFVHFPAEKSLFQPHVPRQEDGGIGRSYQQAPVEIVLAVDFVEFADGSRWGDDLGKSGERLDGQRAGGNAAITKYREILAKAIGINGLESAFAESTLIKPESNAKSADWRDGFKSGVDIVKRRVIDAKLKGGEDGIRKELDKPFDSKSGRREP